MKESLRKLKTKKIIISAIIVLLLFFMVGLLTILKPSIKDIKISKVLTNTKTLSASVIDGVSEEITSNNYDEIKYKLEVNKDDLDTAVITGTLSDKENKYARFKKTSDSEVSDDGKTITVTTTKNKVTITVIVENAPYGITFKPNFNINSEDESKSKINVDPVTITGKSVEGTVLDENGTIYTGIELSLFKNGEEIKKTYSKEDGKYVFSLGNLDSYEIKLAETKYKLVRYTEETTDQNRRILNLVIKEVEPFTLNISKTISKLDLVINGKKESFNYNDETKVLKSIKNAKTIEGSIYYNIYLKNDGEVKGTISTIQDVIPEGLSFDESKNPGWTKEDNNLFYTPLEGTELDAFEKTSATLVLDIVKTDEAKTYINTAIAHGDDYKYVVYYLNGNIYKELYVINSEKIQNINPNIENFAGWYTDRNYTNKYNFSNEVTKDLALYGKIENKKYNVTFIDKNPNNNVETVLAIVEVSEGESVTLVDHPEYNGYTFKCFELYNSCYDDEPITGDTVIYTSYTINNYDIEYDLDDGVVAVANPTSYTVKDSFTLNNPTKEGFTFIGWTGTDLTNTTKTVTIPEGSTGKRTYTAHYEINRSTLTVNPNGGTYEDNASLVTFTEDYGTLKVLSESVRRGYNFRRYDHVGGGTYQNLTYLFDNDDATLTAVYEIINYSITYENITDAERTTLNNKVEYNVETDTFTLNNPSTRLDDQGNNYQDFLGWDDGNGNVSLTVTIPKGSIGDRTYTAVWRENEDDYGITYELHGGSYEEGKSNSSTYTRQTNTFTLNNPNKDGYDFIGWTGTGLSSATETVTIIKGSAGDRAYEANYQVIPYEIRYHGLNSSEEAALNNPTGYNIESNSITLTNPTRTGYEFIGWSGTDITDKSTSVIIPTGSTGNREYTANFRELEYSLTYTLNGGDYETGKSNPDKYTIESDPITLNNPSKTGYTFKGWSGTDLIENENTLVTIPTGSIGHRSFLANYTPVVYNITYDYNGGNLPAGITNPDRYTIESDEITFNIPEKEGYSFLHYKEGNNIITNIPTGSIGDKSLKAYYQINKYNVVYHNDDIVYATDEVDWNTTTTAPNENPTKAHGIFLYWSEDGINPYNFSTKITANKDLYAVYEMVIEPVITYTPTLDETTNRTWVCSDSSNDYCGDTVTITSGKDDSEYTLYYKIGDNTAVEYTGPFKVYENTTITAFAKKSGIYSPNIEEEVINVDTVAPTINNPGTGAMSFNMSISGTAQDAGSGVKQFTLYVKEKDALVYDDTLTYTSEVFDGIIDHAENYDHTFYGVQDNTEYIVKIVAEDYVGNISEREVEVATHPYVARVVGKNNMLWYTVDPDTKEFIIEDGKEFLMFDSIQTAVDYCADVQCTIQTNPILPVVNESVTVDTNQIITIDLDGRGITSDQSATFVNNGELHIVDRNPRLNDQDEHESIGFLSNTVNKAIVNNNILVVGEGSSEASETFIYPEMDRPIIEGTTNAIEQNDTFYFFDGKIYGDTVALLDNGEDPITQYSYNVIFTGEGDKNVGYLDKVTDPEARIKSTYYAKLKVNNAINAFDSSRTGTVTTEFAKMLSKIKQYGDYGFVYDAVNDEIYSGNNSTRNTTATSYLKLDFTNETEGKFITFDTFIDSYNSSSVGTISISETLNNTGTEIFRTYGNDVSGTKMYYLEAGKTYYIFFKFVRAGGDLNLFEMFKITNFKILGEKQETDSFKIYNDYNYYPFVKQDDGSIIDSNIGLERTTWHSYAIYDLRTASEDINLFLDVEYRLSRYSSAWIYTSNNEQYQDSGVITNRYAYFNNQSGGTAGSTTIKVVLKHGELNYLHFCHYNYYNYQYNDSYFKINSISVSPVTPQYTIENSSLLHNDSDSYVFDTISTWEDLSVNSSDAYLYGPVKNQEGTGLLFDGNDYASLGQINNDEFTWYAKFKANANAGVIIANFESGGAGISLVDNKIRGEAYIDGSYRDIWATEEIEYGRDYETAITYKDGVFILYVDGVEQDRYEGTTLTHPESNTVLMLGANPSGSSATDKYLNGTIYKVKIYDRELSSNEIFNVISTDGLITYLDGTSNVIANSYVSKNKGVNSSTAHSYLEYDLTNVDRDMYLYVNTRISGEYYNDLASVTLTTSPDFPTDTTGRYIYTYGEYDNQSAIIRLPKNQKNYLHFYYEKNYRNNYYEDVFIIKEVKVFNTIEDAYSYNSNNYSKINNYYFEKPILNEKVDTIEILKNITLTTSLVVPEEKEVILDLNGFTLTSQSDDYIIKNKGKLTIIDSEYEDRLQQNVDYKIEQARLFEEAKARYLEDLAEYQEYTGLCDGCSSSEEYNLDHLNVDFNYTGASEEYIVHYSGTYKLQVWGAQGGYRSNSNYGGKGGYSEGIIELNKNDIIYAFVGGSGNTGGTAGGFNGGGSKTTYPGGGGATDMRVEGDTLYHRIIVAGGGGSDGSTSYPGKAGGGLSGVTATETSYCSGGEGGTQTSAGTRGSFGQGGSGGYNANGWGGGGFGGAGGGGWYGGGGVNPDRSDDDRGGGGGSGFVYTDSSVEPVEGYLVSNHILTNATTIVGTEEIPTYDGTSTMIGNSGNGYAKIALIQSNEADEARANLSKTYNIKEEPHLVDYLDGIDFDSSVDINSLDINSTGSYNNTVSNSPSGGITSTISNILLNEQYASLVIDSGAINVNVNSKVGVHNRGNLVLTGVGSINANNSSTVGVFNESNGSISANGGVINTVGSSTTGLLNRSATSIINGIKVVTSQSNNVGISNEAISDVSFNDIDVSGAGTGFRELSAGNTIVTNSKFKSTNSYSFQTSDTTFPVKIDISSSSFSGTFALEYAPRIVSIENSTLTSITNRYANLTINNASFNSIENRGDTFINDATISGSGTLINNYAITKHTGSYGEDYNSDMVIKNSIINSTATSATTVISNNNDLIIDNVTINNKNNVASTAISNSPGSDKGAYLTIIGNTSISSSFGTAISNTGVVTLGTSNKNIGQSFDYGYTGKQEVFTAPEDGLYKLETWGASGSPYFVSRDFGFEYSGGYGAYASGVISLHEGDKLYIHVGEFGPNGTNAYGPSYFGAYNGGGYNGRVRDYWNWEGSGGGATDISLSDEDNTWYYDNGIATSKRSNASYEQRIVVAGGGGSLYNEGYGGYDIAPSSSRLGYGNSGSGGGYYGGTGLHGGSSYVSDSLTNIVMKKGNEEMPDYALAGIMKGNFGNGYAKITLLNNDNEYVSSTPFINAINYGITGSGRIRYLDGTINAKVAVNSDIELVPDNYDIYKSIDENSNEKMVLIPNANSRPVSEGEEEFVAAIGNAKYTTIQNAIDASNNGDEIDLLVNIEQQNTIVVPTNKQVIIDYNGHTVKSYNNNYLYNNLGNLTLTDSANSMNKNIYMGDKLIYNEGSLNISNIYTGNTSYSTGIITNNEGTITMDGVRLDFGSSISNRTAITNTANGSITISNSILNLTNTNNFFSNRGNLNLVNNTITNTEYGRYFVNNVDSGIAILDGNSYSVSGRDDNGRYLLTNNASATATIKNMTTHIEDVYNTGDLTLEGNTIPSGTISNEGAGIVKITSGSYSNTFNNSSTGRVIDNTENLYSFIMNDGTIKTTLNRSGTGIFDLKGGTISVTSGYAVNNSATGVINLGIHDGVVAIKENTVPIITGKTYGIYTSNPDLIVNFYDGIVTGQKSYNVTVEDIETGYTLKRDYDEENDIETKYLTDEPMFRNTTQSINYGTVAELISAISNGLVNSGDVIAAYRNITITKNDGIITIPSGLNITFDINNSIVDKNNETMFINNGELTIIDSVNDSKGKIDSTLGDIIINNGTLNIISGNFISEKYTTEVEVIKNNENAILNISGGTLTKYYDSLGYRQRYSGAIIVNDGEVNVTGGKFYANGSYVIFNYRRIGGNGQVGTGGTGDSNYFFTSAVFVNNATGTLTVTGGEYDGITSASFEDNYGWQSYATTNTGELIYNYGIATFDGITSNNSHIGRNDGTMSMDNVTMEKIVNINHQRYTWNSNRGSHQNFINTGNLTIDNSSFKLYTTLVDNRGNLDITNTTIDRLGDGTAFSNEGDSTWLGPQSSYLIRTVYNANRDNYTNITNCNLYNKGSGEAIYNNGLTNVVNTTIETSSSSGIISISGIVNVSDQTSVTSSGGAGASLSNSTLNLGKPIDIDSAVSKTYPMLKGNTYGVTNSNSTFNFYDGIIMGKSNPISGVITTIEDGYTIVEDVDGDYKTNYLDRIPIIQNITQATEQDEKKYYDLDVAFSEAQNGDTLKMISNYSTLPTAITAVNDANVTFDLNGKFIRQTNSLLLTNNATLNIIDSSEDKTGRIIGISGSKVIDNYETINFTSGKITSSVFRLIIKNNTGSTLNIKDEAIINTSNIATLVDNDGALNITNGAYLHNHAGNPIWFQGTNDGLPMIINRNELNIIDLNNDDDDVTSSEYAAPKLHSEGVALHGFNYGFELGYYDSIIRNETNANAIIYGGTFNNGSTTSPDYGKTLYNLGTVVMKNMDSYAYVIGFNRGSLTIENSKFNNFSAGALVNMAGTLVVRNTSFNFYQPEFDSSFYGNNDVMYIKNATLDNVTMTGGQHTYNDDYPLRMINIVGPTEIIDSSINLIAQTGVLYNNSTLTITNTPLTMDKALSNEGTITLDNSNVTVTNSTGISNSGTVNLVNSDVTVTNGTAISNSGKINFNTDAIVSTTKGNGIYNTGKVTIPVGVTIITQDGNGIYLDGNGKLVLGEIGGVPDQTSPYIEGSNFGIYNNSRTTELEFFDGLVVGKSDPNAIYGIVTNIEAGYETEDIIVTDGNNVQKHNEHLVVSATSVAVAQVGTYTFASVGTISPSKALQNAINFAIGDGTDVKRVNLVTDVDLTNDEVSLVASQPVVIDAHSLELKHDSTYGYSSNITVINNGFSANLSRLLASIISPITRDIIIYEMSDGNSLDVNKTYKLYKDGELVKLAKEELGKYSYKGNNEDLTPIKGRLYINDLTSGSYRLVSSDNRYIEFSINDEGNISGNVSEYISKNYGSTSKASAELILTIQTGFKKHYYLLAIIPISLLIIALIVIIRKRKVS